MAELKTFVFTDISGSVRLKDEMTGRSVTERDQAFISSILTPHRQRIEAHLTEFGGRVVSTAGDGHFLNQISPRLVPPSDVLALEYNVHSLEKLRKRGYRAEATEVADLVARGERFGAIFMFQVLEHRAEPHELFAAFAELLAPRGRLFFAVPNDTKARFGADDDEFIDPPPSHVCRWQPGNFGAMAERYGFELRESLIEPFSLGDFVRNDLVCSYMRRSQEPRTLANALYSHR